MSSSTSSPLVVCLSIRSAASSCVSSSSGRASTTFVGGAVSVGYLFVLLGGSVLLVGNLAGLVVTGWCRCIALVSSVCVIFVAVVCACTLFIGDVVRANVDCFCSDRCVLDFFRCVLCLRHQLRGAGACVCGGEVCVHLPHECKRVCVHDRTSMYMCVYTCVLL